MTREARIAGLLADLQEGIVFKDGAMGTTLSASGHTGQALELLNVDDPDRVKAVHASYVAVGSQVVETNTFQGNAIALERHGLRERATELNRAGAALAREAVGEEVLVAGSMGPTGALLEPYGETEPEAARDAFAEQAAALAEGGADLLVLETFSAIEELLEAVAGALPTGLPVVASMAFDPGGRTAFGVTPAGAAQRLADAGASIIGANCGTVSPRDLVPIIAEFKQATTLPIMAQPNAGTPERVGDGVRFPEDPATFGAAGPGLAAAGAALIGGCCGTTPEHIAELIRNVRAAE